MLIVVAPGGQTVTLTQGELLPTAEFGSDRERHCPCITPSGPVIVESAEMVKGITLNPEIGVRTGPFVSGITGPILMGLELDPALHPNRTWLETKK